MSSESHKETARNFLKADWATLEAEGSDQTNGAPTPLLEKPAAAGAPFVGLVPAADFHLGTLGVRTAIGRRKSRRSYAEGAISLEELSYLLWATQGVRRQAEKYTLRNSPSGGARHPLETYIYAARVSGVEPGLYRYLPIEHTLTELRPDMEARSGTVPSSETRALDAALFDQYWNAACVFVWTAIPYRSIWRYSGEGPKLVALDAGHACQNLYLACESVGLGTCAVGAYDQDRLDAFLGVDGREEYAIYAAPVGKSKD